jgi:ACS family sodium-dependent inorganic phosphate cotransporter
VGISGSIGMLAAIVSPLIAGIILDVTGSWTLIFHICTAVLVFGGIFYLFFASASEQFK